MPFDLLSGVECEGDEAGQGGCREGLEGGCREGLEGGCRSVERSHATLPCTLHLPLLQPYPASSPPPPPAPPACCQVLELIKRDFNLTETEIRQLLSPFEQEEG